MFDDRQGDLLIWAEAYKQEVEQGLDLRELKGVASDREYEIAVIKNAAKRARRNTLENWDKIRRFVWERDKGVCQICKQKINYSNYNCGHIVDRVCGGSDRPENLVVMCSLANMLDKPLTETRAKYVKWIKEYKSCTYVDERVICALIQLLKS